jgi:hypothetical protein
MKWAALFIALLTLPFAAAWEWWAKSVSGSALPEFTAKTLDVRRNRLRHPLA